MQERDRREERRDLRSWVVAATVQTRSAHARTRLERAPPEVARAERAPRRWLR